MNDDDNNDTDNDAMEGSYKKLVFALPGACCTVCLPNVKELTRIKLSFNPVGSSKEKAVRANDVTEPDTCDTNSP